jgi:hypothetical protein
MTHINTHGYSWMSHKKIISQVNVHDELDHESSKMIFSTNMNMKK